jgi:tetratricopeptide (TPR) repeat protein
MHTAYQHFRRCVDLARAHGFGRIEVANLLMTAASQLYCGHLRDALSQALAGMEAASRVGHFRAQLNLLEVGGYCLFEMGEMARAKQLLEQSLPLIKRLGSRRFEPISLLWIAKIVTIQGQYDEAIQLLERAVAISRETGPSFAGAWALGALAAVTRDAEVRQTALAEGERLLAAGCVSHNYFWFYRDAMEATLGAHDWDEVDRYAASLEAYTRPEPLPWSNFFIARGRALAALGRGGADEAPLAALIRLQDEGQRQGLVTALTAIEAALAGREPS